MVLTNEATPLESFRIHPATQLGRVHLTVTDLDRELAFYQDTLGLALMGQEGRRARLGAGGAELLRLTEDPLAGPARNTTGLYHFAVLLPSRKELARVLARLLRRAYPNYPTDHVMTQTTYLDDPEGNGIELYADTPEEGWFGVIDGAYVVRDARRLGRTGRDALDVESLLRELAPGDALDAPMPEGTRIGHVHLHVADLAQAVGFYHGVLGFDDQGSMPEMGMAMVSAGGYHHHIGLNIWKGRGAPPAPPGASGLRDFTVACPGEAELKKVLARVRAAGLPVEPGDGGFLVRDPSQNAVRLTAGPVPTV